MQTDKYTNRIDEDDLRECRTNKKINRKNIIEMKKKSTKLHYYEGITFYQFTPV